jgi:hypothetical protein
MPAEAAPHARANVVTTPNRVNRSDTEVDIQVTYNCTNVPGSQYLLYASIAQDQASGVRIEYTEPQPYLVANCTGTRQTDIVQAVNPDPTHPLVKGEAFVGIVLYDVNSTPGHVDSRLTKSVTVVQPRIR